MDRNTWLAILICITIYLIWFQYVMPYFTPQAPEQKPAPVGKPEGASSPSPSSPPADKPVSEPSPSVPAAVKEVPVEKPILLDAPDLLIRTEWTNEGAALNRLELKDYFTDITRSKNVVLVEPFEGQKRTLSIVDTRARVAREDKARQAVPLDTARYQVVKRTDRSVCFQTAFSNGLEVTKDFEVIPQKYELHLRVTLRNAGKTPLQQAYSLIAPAGIVPDTTTYMRYLTTQIAVDLNQRGQSVPPAERLVDIKVQMPTDTSEGPGLQTPGTFGCLPGVTSPSFEVEGAVAWAAVASNYFALITRPEEGKAPWLFRATSYPIRTKIFVEKNHTRHEELALNVRTEFTTRLFDLKPGESATQEFLLYAGPKRASALAAYGNMLGILDYDYGMFGAITKLFLWLLAAFYKVIPNFGWGIVFLTFLVKVVLHPLTRKTQVSMYKLQKLQPKINALREKYKHDQKTLGQEQWKLFREHRVNPLGGCLPMFLQIPVLIALYNGIAYSIEFRQQPFIGWIRDLARPDMLAVLPFQLPLLGDALNVLPIVMVVTWVIQQQTMPKPADPQQAAQQKVMMFMPIVFGFMFYSMPSGLVLYWLVNTLLSIVEQYYIKKTLAKIVIE